jgi:hypothetical protein
MISGEREKKMRINGFRQFALRLVRKYMYVNTTAF